MSEKRAGILQTQRNCWTLAPVTRSGLLIDGANYFASFFQAAAQAQRYILIAGWRFSSNLKLVPEEEPEMGFLSYLDRLCANRPDLHIYILAWDFSILYALEWELFQNWRFLRSDRRLQFRFDSHHATGACHHQKFVVMDGQLAFIGGIDFKIDSWDDRSHQPDHPLRRDPQGVSFGPYHDIQGVLEGPAAEELAGFFQTRWSIVGGDQLDLKTSTQSNFYVEPTISLPGSEIAFSRTQAKTLSNLETIEEIRVLYEDAIEAAEELIYIENQYFSSQAVQKALLHRMEAADRPRLDIVLILPKRPRSWLEVAALLPTGIPLIDSLREIAQKTGHRLGLYYVSTQAAEGREDSVLIHSKLMIVDDRFLTVGSANLSNRSMGLDTELNASWETTDPDTALGQAIRRTRVDLAAEHCGFLASGESQSVLESRHGLVNRLDGLAQNDSCRLKPLTREVMMQDDAWLKSLIDWNFSLDPDRPLIEEAISESFWPASESSESGWSRQHWESKS